MKRSTEKAIAAFSLLMMISGLFRSRGRGVPKTRPGKGSSPGAAGSARERWDPLGIKPKTAAAIASGDPQRMRDLARSIRAEGYAAEADELEAAATAAERKP